MKALFFMNSISSQSFDFQVYYYFIFIPKNPTLPFTAVMGLILLTKIQAAGRRRKRRAAILAPNQTNMAASMPNQTLLADLLDQFESLMVVLMNGRSCLMKLVLAFCIKNIKLALNDS